MAPVDAPAPTGEGDEARGRDLLHQPLAWALQKRLSRRASRVARRFLLFDRLFAKDRFTVVAWHPFNPDRLSDSVVKRSTFCETYARPMRDKRDSELDDRTTDAIENDVMPQFNLRNIGRYEMAVDVEGGLPWQREATNASGIGKELREVRAARHHPPEPIAIWSVAYTARLRAQLRRLVLEDPWEMKYGPEATSVHAGLGREFVVDGTHPDDLPGADFAPPLIARPQVWTEAPKGEARGERPFDIAADAARIHAGKEGTFEM